MKYFVYCRKSTDREDRQILGTDAQKRLLLEHADRQGLAVVEVYVENQTAYKAGRPLFEAMLRRLEKGEAAGILTYHLTRLARNSFDGGRLIYMMDEKTIQEIATPEKAYTNNGDDKFMMQIHFAMAKKSSDDTSQFVRRDVESKLLKGEYPGMAPPGYVNINRDGHITKKRDDPAKYMKLLELGRPLRRVEIDPVEGPLVARLFDEAGKGGRSLAALRNLSHDLGLRSHTGGKLTKTTIAKILTNPYYHGAIRYRGRLYTENIQHDALVTRAQFERVQEAIGRRFKGSYRKHFFAFAGCSMTCGCGRPITAERQKGHVYYHCTGRATCPERAWTREEKVTAQLADLFARLRLPEGYVAWSLDRLQQSARGQAHLQESRRLKLQAQSNHCQARLSALLQMRISPENADGSLLTEAEYRDHKAKLREELDGIEAQLADQRKHVEVSRADFEHFFAFTQSLAWCFGSAPPEKKRDVLFLICSKLVLRGGLLEAQLRPPFAKLSAFPLAGRPGKGQFDPDGWRTEAEKPGIVDQWLVIVDAIRTMSLSPATLPILTAPPV